MNESAQKGRKKPIGRILFSLLVTVGIGSLGGFVARNGFARYKTLDLPPFAAPGWIFPIVWTVLYLIMSIGLYRLTASGSNEKTKNALTIFVVYMVLNFLWPTVFFDKGAFFVALLLACAQLILLGVAAWAFYPISKTAALTLIPTAAWTVFALYLNTGVALMN